MEHKETDKNFYYKMFFLFLFAFLLRIYNITFQSLWLDEIANIIISDSQSLSQLLIEVDKHPYVPYYYVVLYFLKSVVPLASENVRIFSIFFGCLGVLTFYSLLHCMKINKKSSFLLTLLYSCLFVFVYFSREIAPYSLIMFLTPISSIFLIKWIEEDNRKSLFCFWIISAILLGIHFLNTVFVLSQGIAVLFVYVRSKKDIMKFFITFPATVVFLLPFISKALELNSTESLYSPGVVDFFRYYYRVFSNKPLVIMISGIALWGIFKVFRGIEKIDKKPILLILTAIISLVILFIKSKISTPAFQFRYFCMVYPLLIGGYSFISLKFSTQINLKTISWGS